MYQTIDFDIYSEYEEWLESIQTEMRIEIVSVTGFKNSLVVTYKKY